MPKGRNDELDRQKLEVAKVFEQMLGIEDALDYLRREGLQADPPAPAAAGTSPLPQPSPASPLPHPFPSLPAASPVPAAPVTTGTAES
ncbi:hypothetical protein IP91_00570 [Pseudoduganella lurida]|uniref:Uncharacterized protein n=1 Tax=Pseudoduganella lurida TaxID=1036180 RepID=A0A562RKG3_9BURK|nr:hypothetical protein [Pseudoduganella lurida]TWI69501.1 hypothetical protein IP91_00570 [Pseudoduganella lurida]